MVSMQQNTIYQGNSVISVETLPEHSRPVVIKKPSKRHPSRRSLRALEKEYEMTRSLNTVTGVRKALGQQSIKNQPALILEYIDGETLLDYIGRKTLSLRAKLELAVDLARVLGNIHQQDVIHLDLNSKNILIANEHQAVRLIDLGSAAHIDRSGQQKVRPDQLLGTLPYISPEQTGRINRAVDERSDLYSLGVVLYELMTLQLPFDSKDPMQLIHHHLTRIPVSPSEVSSEIPEVISTIILKLLRKNAEDRYQSAAGAQVDLEKCLQRLKPDNTIEDFPLGEADYASRLIFPQKLFGRESELKELVGAFNSACRETSSMVFVSGYSGIGKTGLVEEIQRPVSEKSGYFIQGKFDQLVTTPYAGITQAFAQLVSQILTQTETQLAAWRSTILEAVGPNGRVLTDVVPSLELVIGPQPAVPALSGQEAQNRFNYVFQRFFGAIARSEHPICFFLDDLQWVDPGSLDLLKNLFSSPDLEHLLIVGAYRDNEVDEAHPLMTFIADLEKAGANLKRMTLKKLSEADVEALISDALRHDPDETRELSRLIYAQTDGNPFFTRQVLRSMEDRNLIALDTATGHWRWDMDALRGQHFTTNVVELLVSKLKALPTDIQETLKVAACIGNQFDIAILTVVTEGDDDAIHCHVHAAVAAGLIWERDDRGYFVHDRVQEAAYALVQMEEQDRLHLTIGRLLLQRHRMSDDKQDIYRIVDQLNHGRHLVEDEQERMQLARLNLQAARAARQATAFETGLTYAKAGIELLGENSWDQDYRFTLELQEQAAMLAFAAGDIPCMEHHSEQVLQFGRDPLDLARVQGMRMAFLIASKRYSESLDLGLEALRVLGQEFPSDPEWEFTQAEMNSTNDRFQRESSDLPTMPPLRDQDPQLAAIAEILQRTGMAAFVARPALSPLIFMRFLELCFERQLLPVSTPFTVSALGMWVSSLLDKPEAANRYGVIALQLAAQEPFGALRCTVLFQIAGYLHFWQGHLRETLDLLQRAIRSGHDYGNNEFIAYSFWGWSKHALYVSMELDLVEEQITEFIAFLNPLPYQVQSRFVNIFVTAAQALRGSSTAIGVSWRGTLFDDDRDLPDMDQSGDRLGLLNAYCAKSWVATLFGDYSGIEKYIDLARSHLEGGPSMLENAIVAFVCGLRYARELREKPDRPESEQALQEQLGLLERFAGLAPMNFAHKLSLVQAEVHRARGEVLPAMQAYEQAGQGARENGYLNEAGLAHALAAEFYLDLGLHQAALHNAEQAAQTWRSWGAHALVESLSHRFADLLETSGLSWQSSSDAGKVHTTITQSITPIQLDMESIISASQLLSAETDLKQLLTKMMTLVMANSGAEKAVLLLRRENEWFVQALSDIMTEKLDILLNQPFDPADSETDIIPESVFNYCRRSKEVLVVGDAQLDHRFSEDSMIQKHNIKSMSCIPALNRGELKAILYLENRQISYAFTLERVEILKHLSSQFGVSVENALLYDSLNQKVRELRESEERLSLIYDSVADILYYIRVEPDDCFRFLSINHAFLKVAGLTSDQIVGKRIEEVIPETSVRLVLDNYKKAIKENRIVRWEETSVYPSGEKIGDVSIAPVLNEKGICTHLVGSVHDITERREAELNYRTVADFTYDWEYWANMDGTLKYVSPSCERISSYSVQDFIDNPSLFREIILPQDREVWDRHYRDSRQELKPREIQFRIQRRDGQIRWIEHACQPVTDDIGRYIGFRASNRDITDRKQAEIQLRDAYTEIEQLKNQLEAESAYLQDEIKLEHNFKNIIGKSESLKYVLNRVELVAPTDSPVLIMGETGTGKELMARALHELSPHGKRALVKVNCAALPGELIESELFGREKGAFTGATATQLGRFELAKGSTIFLDEIGELPLELQAKLLRVIESGEFERLGSSRTLHSDARIIAATNRVLEQEVRKGRFREDLWYRLKVFPITVPPLREHPEDISLLVKWFLDQFSRKMGKPEAEISKRTMQMLQSYPWPGNVRELKHAVEGALITAQGKNLYFELPKIQDTALNDFKSFEEMERNYILRVLKARNWKIGGENSAASTLGMHVSTLRGRMKKLGIKKPKPQ